MRRIVAEGRSRSIVAWVALVAWLLVPAFALAQDRDRDRTRDQLRDQLRTDAGLTDAELQPLDADLDAYAKQKGDPAVLGETVRAAKGDGCTGVCLRETVRTMNRAMQQGMDCPQAGEMTRAIVREQLQARAGKSDQQLAQRVQERATERLREREREHAGPEGQPMQREMQREMKQGGAGGPPDAAGGGGKGGKH